MANNQHDLASGLRERVERLLSAQARETLLIGYDCADVPTVVIGAAGVPCLLHPKDDHTWELTCPWWTAKIAEDEMFESKVLAHVGKLTEHLAQAFAPVPAAMVN